MGNSPKQPKLKNETLLRLGRAIGEIRRERKISQEQLALEAELNRTYMNRLETGKTNVSILSLQKLTKVLQVSMAEVLFKAKI